MRRILLAITLTAGTAAACLHFNVLPPALTVTSLPSSQALSLAGSDQNSDRGLAWSFGREMRPRNDTDAASCGSLASAGVLPGNSGVQNLEAWNRAVVDQTRTIKCWTADAGTYRFSAAPAPLSTSSSTESLGLYGAGADLTVFQFPVGSNGFSFKLQSQYNSLHLDGFTACTLGGGAVGLQIRQTQSIVENPANTAQSDVIEVTARGCDGYAKAAYWGTGAEIVGVSNINLISDDFVGFAGEGWVSAGTGVLLRGNSSTFPVVANFMGDTFNYVGKGVIIDAYVQGVTFVSSNFVGGDFGVASNDYPINNLDQLSITTSQFNCRTVDVDIPAALQNVSISGNYFIMPAPKAVALRIFGGAGLPIGAFSIAGNAFDFIEGGDEIGISIEAPTARGGVIEANSFSRPYRAQTAGTGVLLGSSSRNVIVGPNSYQGLASDVVNRGADNVTGATCSGGPSPSFSVTNGIVTHC